MDGVALLSQAREAGLKVVVQNGCLRIRGPRKSAALSQLLISNKAAVITALKLDKSVNQGPDLRQLDSGPGTETPENQASEGVSGPANRPSHSFGGGHSTGDGTAKPHRLIGNNYPPRLSEQPPESIHATRAEICPRCNRGRVLRELRQMTGGKCWPCWEAVQNARS